jgi:prefoldin subunit 5
MSDLKEQLEQCEADAEEFCAEISSLNGTISKLRQALREATLKHIPATDPLYRTAVKLLNETEPK